MKYKGLTLGTVMPFAGHEDAIYELKRIKSLVNEYVFSEGPKVHSKSIECMCEGFANKLQKSTFDDPEDREPEGFSKWMRENVIDMLAEIKKPS